MKHNLGKHSPVLFYVTLWHMRNWHYMFCTKAELIQMGKNGEPNFHPAFEQMKYTLLGAVTLGQTKVPYYYIPKSAQ